MEITGFISEREIIDIAVSLITAEGHKDVVDRESKVVQYIKNLLENENIIVETKEIETNRCNVYGSIEGDEKEVHLMFNGHTDTIPAFDMNYEPFKPFIENGILYGRGSADMKGGIAAMLGALLAIKRQGIKLRRTVMFAGVIDEEECSKGTEQMIKDQIYADYVVIGEPTSLRVCTAHKGMEWIQVRFKGQSTHGSRPHEGKSAIYMASEFCKLIYEELEPEILKKEFDLLGNGTINVGKISGGNDPNIVPDNCIVQIDRRWLPNETLESVYQEIEKKAILAAKKFGGTYEISAMRDFTASMGNAPHNIDAKNEIVLNALQISADVTGENQPPRDFPAWSDAGLISNHTNAKCIILGPGNITQAHANDEFCAIDEIMKASEIYFQLIKKICM